MRRTLITTSLLLGLTLSGAASAGPDHGRDGREHGPGRGMPLMRELRELDLSDEQRAQIKQLAQATHQQSQTQRDALAELHHRFTLAAPGSSEFRALTTQLADAESTQARQRVTAMAELRTQIDALLTPAQRTQLATELAKMPPPDEREHRRR